MIHTHTHTHTPHTMKYYSAIKKDILVFVTSGTSLEGILLSEISQAEKDKYPTVNVTYMWNNNNRMD